jgi:hypothetical protein
VGFDKFKWIRAVTADGRLAPVERLILTNIALVNAKHGEDTFCVRQTTVAERCASTKKSVGGALRNAKRLGYMVDGSPRQRGRGYFKADEHRLTFPEIGNHLTPFPEEEVTNGTEIGNQRGTEKVTNGTEKGNQANSLTSGNDTLKGIYKGLKKGGGEGYGDAAPPPSSSSSEENKPPIPYCSRHQPDGTDTPCRACGEARRTYEAWEAAELQRKLTADPGWIYGHLLPNKPLNHDDVSHPETWEEWCAGYGQGLPVEQPNRYCAKHPHGGQPCGACADHRELNTRWCSERAEWQEWNRDLRRQIKACTRCSDYGLYTDDEGQWWCQHHARDEEP